MWFALKENIFFDDYMSFLVCFSSLLILAGFQPESEWDRAQSESVMITANDLVDTLGYQLYMYIVWKVKLISGVKFVVID